MELCLRPVQWGAVAAGVEGAAGQHEMHLSGPLLVLPQDRDLRLLAAAAALPGIGALRGSAAAAAAAGGDGRVKGEDYGVLKAGTRVAHHVELVLRCLHSQASRQVRSGDGRLHLSEQQSGAIRSAPMASFSSSRGQNFPQHAA